MTDWSPHLHPRDRLGRWIRTFRLPTFEVGGVVRDSLLGKDPKDVDYIALGTPEEIKAAVEEAGGRAEELVVRDRVVGVRAYGPEIPPEGVEIAPPRTEISTGPGRKDFEIVPHPDASNPEVIHEDAVRRDFTVNALYRDPETGEIRDPTGTGRADLEARVLRTTHETSFRDDPLRILRAARFAAQHGLTPEPDTLQQMRDYAPAISALTQGGVSGTVEAELNKMLMSDKPSRGLRLLRDTGALAVLLPELEPMIGFDQESKWHELTADEHTFRVVDGVAAQGGSLEARLAALFHDSGKPQSAWRGEDGRLHYYENPEMGKRDHAEIGAQIAQRTLDRLNYPDAVKRRVRDIVENHMLPEANKPKAVKARKLLARPNPETVQDLLVHRRADMLSKGEDDDGSVAIGVDKLSELIDANADAPVRVGDLEITGHDLIDAGIPRGPEMGETLDELMRQVIGQPDLNNREWLLRQLKKKGRKYRPGQMNSPPIPDEWWKNPEIADWQHGLCQAYSLAMLEMYPHLRLGTLDGGAHFFTHDDEYAYDSLGRHKLPYNGLDGNMVQSLDEQPEWYTAMRDGDRLLPENGDASDLDRAKPIIAKQHPWLERPGQMRSPATPKPDRDIPDNFDAMSTDEQMAWLAAGREKVNAWQREMNIARSLGQVDEETAKELGSHGDEYRPLPPKLYHVTPVPELIEQTGLKTREEIGVAGLGGGNSDMISFTADADLAQGIASAMAEVGEFIRGETTLEDLIRAAEAGELADRPFLTDFMRQWGRDWNPGDPYPDVVQRHLAGEHLTLDYSPIPQTREHWQAKGLEPYEPSRWTLGAEGAPPMWQYGQRPMTEEERLTERMDFMQAFLAYRQGAGGPLDPLFWGVDAAVMADIRRENIGIIEAEPIPGARGSYHAGLDEYRVPTGQAVQITGVRRLDDTKQISKDHSAPRAGMASPGITRLRPDTPEEEAEAAEPIRWPVHRDPTETAQEFPWTFDNSVLPGADRTYRRLSDSALRSLIARPGTSVGVKNAARNELRRRQRRPGSMRSVAIMERHGSPETLNFPLKEEEWVALTDGFEAAGLRLQATEVSIARGLLTTKGDVRNEEGKRVGNYKVGIYKLADDWPDGSPRYVMKLDELFLDPGATGGGFADSVMKHVEEELIELGAWGIQLEAVSVGAYAWARQGYLFDDRDKDNEYPVAAGPTALGAAREIVRMVGNAARDWRQLYANGFPGTNDEAERLWEDFLAVLPTKEDIAAYEAGDFNAFDGKLMTPQDVAMWGFDGPRWEYNGIEWWFGKAWLIRNASWDGWKPLNRDRLEEADTKDIGDFYWDWLATKKTGVTLDGLWLLNDSDFWERWRKMSPTVTIASQ